MSRSFQHQRNVLDTLNADMITKNNLEALVEFRGQWYRVEKGQNLNNRSMHFFDTVVVVNESHYTIVKDRNGNRRGIQGILDVLKVRLFAEGKTLADLPKYYEDIKEGSTGPLNLFMDDDGNLVAMSSLNNYDPMN